MGHSSLTTLTTGGSNVSLGYNSGITIINGSQNICIGSEANVNSSSSINRVSIGYNVSATADNSVFFPSNLTALAAATDANFSGANGGRLFPVSSTRRLKTDITDIITDIDTTKVYNLRPVACQQEHKF